MTGPPNRPSAGLTQRMQAVAAEVFAKRDAAKAAAPPSLARQQFSFGTRFAGVLIAIGAVALVKFVGMSWTAAYFFIGFGVFLVFHAEVIDFGKAAPALIGGILGALKPGGGEPPAAP